VDNLTQLEFLFRIIRITGKNMSIMNRSIKSPTQ
jgi:hypothetical protein